MCLATDILHAQALSQIDHLAASYAAGAKASIVTTRGVTVAEVEKASVEGVKTFRFELDFTRALDTQLEALECALSETWALIPVREGVICHV